MRRLFTLFMMIWALLSVSQQAKATDFYVVGCFENEDWASFDEKLTDKGDNSYSLEYTSTKSAKLYFRFRGSDWNGQMAPDVNGTYLTTTSPYTINHYTDTNVNGSYPYANNSFCISMTNGTTYVFTFVNDPSDASKRNVSCKVKSDDNGGGGSNITNPLAGRVLTEGYYLVGNFFSFDDRNDINYDDAVFKFQQQSNDKDGNAIYMVEIPATLTAMAQVMSVNFKGEKTAVYGPGEAYGISNTWPALVGNSGSVGPYELIKSSSIEKGTNYWNMTSRRKEEDKVEDGSYQIYITVDPAGNLKTWTIKYNNLKRIAYFLSTEKSATALAISSIRNESNSGFNSGKYYGTLYLNSSSEFYAISNDVANKSSIDDKQIYDGYNVLKNEYPTYDKLFLFGNGSKGINDNDEYKKVAANNGTFKYNVAEGLYTLEFNSNKGNNNLGQDHGGLTAEVLPVSEDVTISAISMVGPAIPGTMNGDAWLWNSTAGDMTWDENENCYKLTLVTTAQDDGSAKFRFVGNHTQKINWHENTKDDENEKARIDYDSENPGHAATASDPNEVCYTQSDEHNEADYHIIWNRDANRWTVRFYIYTYTGTDGNPTHKYYYTITENHDLELRDFGDVVYKSEDNVRNVLYRGDYRYFRTWSGKKAWKVPSYVDVYVVSGMSQSDDIMDGQKTAKYTLAKLNDNASYKEGDKNIIPANTGVILAVKDIDLANTEDAVLKARKSLTSYNTLVIPMEAASDETQEYEGDNLLRTCVTAQNIPTFRMNGSQMEYNYLFGFYHRMTAFGIKEETDNIKKDQYILGFWISGGSGSFYSNSAYLPVSNEMLGDELNMLGTSYKDFDSQTKAKKVPALFFDFAHVDDNSITGIKEIHTDCPKADGKYYTLSGIQVSVPTKSGIYIHNGKKLIIK